MNTRIEQADAFSVYDFAEQCVFLDTIAGQILVRDRGHLLAVMNIMDRSADEAYSFAEHDPMRSVCHCSTTTNSTEGEREYLYNLDYEYDESIHHTPLISEILINTIKRFSFVYVGSPGSPQKKRLRHMLIDGHEFLECTYGDEGKEWNLTRDQIKIKNRMGDTLIADYNKKLLKKIEVFAAGNPLNALLSKRYHYQKLQLVSVENNNHGTLHIQHSHTGCIENCHDDNSRMSFRYDKNQRLIARMFFVDFAALDWLTLSPRVDRCIYDEQGRLWGVIEAQGTMKRFFYNRMGALESEIFYEGVVNDLASVLPSISDPDYHAQSRTFVEELVRGQTVTQTKYFFYDAQHRLTRIITDYKATEIKNMDCYKRMNLS